MARIQKKEGFIRTPPNRDGPSSFRINIAKVHVRIAIEFSISPEISRNWRRPRLLPTFLAFCKAKTAYFSHFEAKRGKGKKQKGRPELVVLFWVEKCTFSPVLSKIMTKT